MNENEPVWEYVPLDEYKPPADSVQRTVKTRLSGFWRKLGLPEKNKEAAKENGPELEVLPPEILQAAAPVPDWQDAAAALGRALKTTFSEKSPRSAAVVVGAPFSGHAAALVALADAAGWTVISPPSLQQVLQQDTQWPKLPVQGRSPWVMPLLEKSFLRHERGLGLVRRLLTDSVSGRFGRGVIGCGSWAWAFLQRVSAETEVVEVLTAQALDAQRLQRWFSRIAPVDRRGGGFRFKPTGTATELLSPYHPAGEDARDDINRFFTPLAAYSRGIGGVAWSVWRSALRRAPENTGSDSKGTDPARVIRVLPLTALTLPSVPPLDRPEGAFVLHALMIHNALPEHMFPVLVPREKDRIAKALLQLRSAGVVEHRNRTWRVSALAYPAVRSYLRDENYLTDSI